MCAQPIYSYIGLVASMKLATKILHELVTLCMSRVSPRFLALEPERQVFQQQQLTRFFSLHGGAIKIACLHEINLLVFSISTKTA